MQPQLITDPTPLKQCSKCKRQFPATNEYFYRKLAGLQPACKECQKAEQRKYYQEHREEVITYQHEYRRNNPDKIRESTREWRRKNKAKVSEDGRRYREENHEATLAYQREYRKRNPEKIRRSQREYRKKNRAKLIRQNREWTRRNKKHLRRKSRQYREENRDRINARIREWRLNNPIKVRVKNQRRNARKNGLPDTLTPEQWQHALEWFNGCCAYCGRPAGLFHALAVEHFIPISDDDCPGTVAKNCIPACHGDEGCNNQKNRHDPIEWLREKFGPRKAAKILTRIEAFFETVRQIE